MGRIDGIRFVINEFLEGGPSNSLVCSPVRAGNETQPIPENHAVGPFLEARAGRFPARRAKETLVFKVRAEAAVEIIKAGSEDERATPH